MREREKRQGGRNAEWVISSPCLGGSSTKKRSKKKGEDESYSWGVVYSHQIISSFQAPGSKATGNMEAW